MLYPEYHKKTFSRRRQNLIQLIKEPNPFLIILFNSPVYPTCSDAFYKYRADSSFFYLTGLLEEESAALIWNENGKVKYHLFVRPREPLLEQWNGYRIGPEGAKSTLNPDEAHVMADLPKQVAEWFKKVPKGEQPRIYSNFTTHAGSFENLRAITKNIVGHIRNGMAEASGYIEILPYVRSLRMLKDEIELKEQICWKSNS